MSDSQWFTPTEAARDFFCGKLSAKSLRQMARRKPPTIEVLIIPGPGNGKKRVKRDRFLFRREALEKFAKSLTTKVDHRVLFGKDNR